VPAVGEARGAESRPTVLACDRRRTTFRSGAPRRAVFLDRDGTMIVNRPYSADPDHVEAFPDVLEGLRSLDAAGYLLFVVTNQSGIARGFYDEAALSRLHVRLDQIFLPIGSPIRAYYYCPHHVAGRVAEFAHPCHCRKPEPGMLIRAAQEWNLDLRRSWMIGDQLTDLAAGWSVGCDSLLIRNKAVAKGVPFAADLAAAARLISERDAVAARNAA